MRTEQEIRNQIDELRRDPRLTYPSANAAVNAPLALEQCSIRAQIAILQWALESPDQWTNNIAEPVTIMSGSSGWLENRFQ